MSVTKSRHGEKVFVDLMGRMVELRNEEDRGNRPSCRDCSRTHYYPGGS